MDCNATYIGKTKRHLITRIDEHKKGKGGDKNISVVYKHQTENNHNIDFENVEILDVARSDYKLKLKEMLYIEKLKPSLNIQNQTNLFCLIIGNKNLNN